MRKAFSIIFFVLFILFFPGSLFSFNLKQTVLSPVFYKNTFRKIDFYNRVSKLDPQKIADYINSRQTENSQSIDSDQIGTILTFLPPPEMQTFVEKNIDLYVKSSAKGESGAVDLTGIKSALLSKDIDLQTREMVSKMPDTYVPPQTTSKLNKYFHFVPISKILSYFGLGFSILCLVLSILLWPGWRGKLRMSGNILLVFGITIIIGNLILRPIVIPSNFVADFLAGLAHDFAQISKNSFLRLYLIEGLSMVGLGVIFWITSFFVTGEKIVQSAPPTSTPKITTQK